MALPTGPRAEVFDLGGVLGGKGREGGRVRSERHDVCLRFAGGDVALLFPFEIVFRGGEEVCNIFVRSALRAVEVRAAAHGGDGVENEILQFFVFAGGGDGDDAVAVEGEFRDVRAERADLLKGDMLLVFGLQFAENVFGGIDEGLARGVGGVDVRERQLAIKVFCDFVVVRQLCEEPADGILQCIGSDSSGSGWIKSLDQDGIRFEGDRWGGSRTPDGFVQREDAFEILSVFNDHLVGFADICKFHGGLRLVVEFKIYLQIIYTDWRRCHLSVATVSYFGTVAVHPNVCLTRRAKAWAARTSPWVTKTWRGFVGLVSSHSGAVSS